jgi:hypothetical protein
MSAIRRIKRVSRLGCGNEAAENAMPQQRSRRASERGSTLLEFAFVLIITLVLMFGIIDFGRALYSYHFVANAAREGARFASVRGYLCSTSTTPCPAQPDDIKTYVLSLVPLGIDPNNVDVHVDNPPPGNPNGLPVCGTTWDYPGCAVAVQVTYSFNYIFPLAVYNSAPVSFHAGTINMSSTSQMTISR